MKRVFVLAAMAMVLIAATAGAAFAADPTSTVNPTVPFTFTEANPENASIPTTVSGTGIANGFGASAWTYKDAADSAAKTEGSYNAFDDQTGDGTYTTNPHGGYSTTSNKCKTCHAVHRANGAFALMRVDNPDDACNYCHIGSHRHATSEAYFGGSNGIYSSNGHTIGSSKSIPDSSVWQWTETVALTSADGSANVPIRRYMSAKNKIMRYIVHGNRWIRVGPYNLRCASCHQVHNATQQIWKPVSSGYLPGGGVAGTKLTNGYKLLRNSPSGGIQVRGTDINADGTLNASPAALSRAYSRLNHTYYDPGVTGALDGLASNSVDYRIKALETTITLATGDDAVTGLPVQGANITGYTPFKYFAPTNTASQAPATAPVNEASLSWWCADCHNLNIAGKSLAPGFGGGRSGDTMLGDRSHAVPNQFRINASGEIASAGAHCTQCHNNDMPLDGAAMFTGADCGACHVTTQMYHYYKNDLAVGGSTWAARNDARAKNAPVAARSDFPHSGPDWGKKLLNARDRRLQTSASSNNTAINPTLYTLGGANYDTQGSAFDASTDGQDKICAICHGGAKFRAIGYDK